MKDEMSVCLLLFNFILYIILLVYLYIYKLKSK